jgi:hypothetical protein
MTTSGPSVHRTRPRFVVVDVDVDVDVEGKGRDGIWGNGRRHGME